MLLIAVKSALRKLFSCCWTAHRFTWNTWGSSNNHQTASLRWSYLESSFISKTDVI